MNLDGAKAMAHLQSGNSGTKASMEFKDGIPILIQLFCVNFENYTDE
jgi:hypothetical protein